MKISPFTNFVSLQKYNLASLFFSLIFPLFGVLIIWLNKDNFPLAVPFWFSRPWGEAQLAAPVFLWLIPLITASFILVNFSLAIYFWDREKLLSSILLWVNPFVSGLLFISLLEIILVSS